MLCGACDIKLGWRFNGRDTGEWSKCDENIVDAKQYNKMRSEDLHTGTTAAGVNSPKVPSESVD